MSSTKCFSNGGLVKKMNPQWNISLCSRLINQLANNLASPNLSTSTARWKTGESMGKSHAHSMRISKDNADFQHVHSPNGGTRTSSPIDTEWHHRQTELFWLKLTTSVCGYYTWYIYFNQILYIKVGTVMTNDTLDVELNLEIYLYIVKISSKLKLPLCYGV